MGQFTDNTWFETETCCSCGLQFAMTLDFQRQKRKDRTWFYCPAGHSQHYTGESEESKLKRELQRKQQMLEAADARANKAESEWSQIDKAHRKMRSRVMNGVCPCCNRTFQNLLAHMRTEHPEFKEAIPLRQLREAFGMGQAAVAKEVGVSAVYVSAYERNAYLPEYAKRRIDDWVERHQATPTPLGG